MDPTPTGEPPTPPRPRGVLPTTAESWLMLAAGLACLGYGGYTIIDAFVKGYALSLIGLVVIAVGGMIMPHRWIGLAAGILLLGLGIYMFIANYVTLQALLITVLGVIAIAERLRRGRPA